MTIPKKEMKEKAFSTFNIEEVRKMNTTQERKTMFQLKEGPKTYSWPCEVDPNRTITVTTDDLFSKTHDGTIIKHTGVGCYGIHIPDEDLEEIFE